MQFWRLRLACLLPLWLSIVTAEMQALSQNWELLRITPEQFQQHVRALDFAPAQLQAAEQMYADYRREFDDALASIESMNHWRWGHISEPFEGKSPEEFVERLQSEARIVEERWALGARRLESQYFERLRHLAPGLESHVQSLQRAQLRHRTFHPDHMHEVAGTDVDLIKLIEDICPGEMVEPDTAPLLSQYEMQMHDLLLQHDDTIVRHRRLVRDSLNQARHAIAEGRNAGAHIAIAIEALVRQCSLTWEIRHLNDRSVEPIAATLLPDHARQFRKAAHWRIHAYMYPEGGPGVDDLLHSAAQRANQQGDSLDDLKVVEAEYESLLENWTRTIARLYDRVHGRNACRIRWEAVFKDYGLPERKISHPDVGEEELEAECSNWMDICRGLVERIPGAMEELRRLEQEQ